MLTISASFALIQLLIVTYVALHIFYNLFLHPNRKFPGPLLARATVLVSQKAVFDGDSHKWLKALHEEYGPVVRFAPNEISFIEPETWKDVYGHRASSFEKDLGMYGPDLAGSPSGLIRADNVSHARQRKLVSHAFSDKALKDQEELLKGHVGLLIDKLRDVAGAQGKANLVDWYNFTTFDIMGDLTFGETLGQLSSSTYNPWVKATFGYLKVITISRIGRAWPGLTRLLSFLVPADVKAKAKAHLDYSKSRVEERMARKTDRPDIWTFVTRHSESEGKGLTPIELHSNGALFMLAGTETTATLLSGLTHILLQYPEKMQRLVQEVRSAFSCFDDITMTKLSQLEFLNACLEEALRMYPPVPIGLPRKTPKGGATVAGQWVAEGTTVSCNIHSSNYSSSNWKNPEMFVPERFMPEGKEEYADDRRESLNPFSFGPRNCLGKNLAYHEMRLILASVLLHFDLEPCEGMGDWMDQKMFTIWDKPPLFVGLTPIL